MIPPGLIPITMACPQSRLNPFSFRILLVHFIDYCSFIYWGTLFPRVEPGFIVAKASRKSFLWLFLRKIFPCFTQIVEISEIEPMTIECHSAMNLNKSVYRSPERCVGERHFLLSYQLRWLALKWNCKPKWILDSLWYPWIGTIAIPFLAIKPWHWVE